MYEITLSRYWSIESTIFWSWEKENSWGESDGHNLGPLPRKSFLVVGSMLESTLSQQSCWNKETEIKAWGNWSIWNLQSRALDRRELHGKGGTEVSLGVLRESLAGLECTCTDWNHMKFAKSVVFRVKNGLFINPSNKVEDQAYKRLGWASRLTTGKNQVSSGKDQMQKVFRVSLAMIKYAKK